MPGLGNATTGVMLLPKIKSGESSRENENKMVFGMLP
jgi:hypothetical protein